MVPKLEEIRRESMGTHTNDLVSSVIRLDKLLIEACDECSKEQLDELHAYLEQVNASCESLRARAGLLVRNRIQIMD